jgi:hypothetical protein
VHFAREGADVAIVYLDEHKDAEETVALVEKEGRKCMKFAGGVGKPEVGGCIVSLSWVATAWQSWQPQHYAVVFGACSKSGWRQVTRWHWQ